MVSLNYFELKMFVCWLQLIGVFHSVYAENFRIGRNLKSQTSAAEDVVTIPARSCAAISQRDKCAVYSASPISSTSPCHCECRGNKRTFAFSGERWMCSANSNIRQREGCNIQFEGYDDPDSMAILAPKDNVPLMLSQGFCRINTDASRYMLCDGTWAMLTVFTDREAKFTLRWERRQAGMNVHRYTLTVEGAQKLQHLNGRMIKLSLSCPFARSQCLLFKLKGSISCPVSYSQAVDTATTDPTNPAPTARTPHHSTEERATTTAENEIVHLPAEAPTTQKNITTATMAGTASSNSSNGSHRTENPDHRPSVESPNNGYEKRTHKPPSLTIAIVIGAAVAIVLVFGILLVWLRRRKTRNASADLPTAPAEGADIEARENEENSVVLSSTDYEDVFSLGSRPIADRVHRSYRRDNDDVILIGCGPVVEEPCYEDVDEEGLYRITHLTHGKPSTISGADALPSKQQTYRKRYQSLMARVVYTARYSVPENAQERENAPRSAEVACQDPTASASSSCGGAAHGQSRAAITKRKGTSQCSASALANATVCSSTNRDSAHLYHDLEEVAQPDTQTTEIQTASQRRLGKSSPHNINGGDGKCVGIIPDQAEIGSAAGGKSQNSNEHSAASLERRNGSGLPDCPCCDEGAQESPEEPYLELLQFKPTENNNASTEDSTASNTVRESNCGTEETSNNSQSAVQRAGNIDSSKLRQTKNYRASKPVRF